MSLSSNPCPFTVYAHQHPIPIPHSQHQPHQCPSLIFLRPPLPPKLLTCANRPNLLESVELHSKVMRGARAKTVLGAVLDGALLCGVAHSYVDRINEGRVPVIETALVRVMRVCTPPPNSIPHPEYNILHLVKYSPRVLWLHSRCSPPFDLKHQTPRVHTNALMFLVCRSGTIGRLKPESPF